MSKEASVPQGGPTSIAKKLIQAAALAAVLVPLGSVSTEGATLTCGYNGAADGDCGTGSGGASQTFFFTDGGNYSLNLTFFGMDPETPFFIEVTTTPIDQATFDARVAASLGSYDCVTLVQPTLTDPGCRDFSFISSEGVVWDRYETLYAWDFDTEMGGEGPYPNGTDPPGVVPGNIRVLQAPGASTVFSIDMCLAAVAGTPNYVACEYFASVIDPAIRSGDTAFSNQIVASVADTAVPEPASLVLLGTGLAGVLYRKRRSMGR